MRALWTAAVALALQLAGCVCHAQFSGVMQWYPGGALPLTRICNDTLSSGTLADGRWWPKHFLAVSAVEYVIVGLRNEDSRPALLGDVLWSGNGGLSWTCLGRNDSVVNRAGSEAFIHRTRPRVVAVNETGDGVSATNASSSWKGRLTISNVKDDMELVSICVSGGRLRSSRKKPVPGFGDPIDRVDCASLSAVVGRNRTPGTLADSPPPPVGLGLHWVVSAPLPSPVIGHVHVEALGLFSADGQAVNNGSNAGGASISNSNITRSRAARGERPVLIFGGERDDDSEDAWIAGGSSMVVSSAVGAGEGYPSWDAAVGAHRASPGPAYWMLLPLIRGPGGARRIDVKRPVVSWLPTARRLFVMGGTVPLKSVLLSIGPPPAPPDVDIDSGAPRTESPLLDGISVTIPPLASPLLPPLDDDGFTIAIIPHASPSASASPGPTTAPSSQAQTVFVLNATAEVQRMYAQLPEGRPGGNGGSAAGPVAFSLGWTSFYDRREVLPGSQLEECATVPSVGCGTMMAQIGSQLYVRSLINASALEDGDQLQVPMYRVRAHALHNGSAARPLYDPQMAEEEGWSAASSSAFSGLMPAAIDEAPGTLLGSQHSWALQQQGGFISELGLMEDQFDALTADRARLWQDSTAKPGTAAAAAVAMAGMGRYGHILVASPQDGRMYRGTITSYPGGCAWNFSCPRGWHRGSCTTDPLSARCHPCGLHSMMHPDCGDAPSNPPDGGVDGGSDGSGWEGATRGSVCPLLPGRLLMASQVIAASACVGVALLCGLTWWRYYFTPSGNNLQGATAADASGSKRRDASHAQSKRAMLHGTWRLACGTASTATLAMLLLIGPASVVTLSLSPSGACVGSAAYKLSAAVLSLLAISPIVVVAALITTANCQQQKLRLSQRVCSAAFSSWNGYVVFLLAGWRPSALLLLVEQPSAAKAQPAGSDWGGSAAAAAAKPNGSSIGDRASFGWRQLRRILRITAAVQTLLIWMPIVIVLSLAIDLERGRASSYLASAILPLTFAAFVSGNCAIAPFLSFLRTRGVSGSPAFGSVASPGRMGDDEGGIVVNPLPISLAATSSPSSSSLSIPADASAAGTVTASVQPPLPVHAAVVTVADLWRLAQCDAGRQLAGHGLFFRTHPALLRLAAVAVQRPQLDQPWVTLLRRLEAMATQDPCSFWASASAAADELLQSLGRSGGDGSFVQSVTDVAEDAALPASAVPAADHSQFAFADNRPRFERTEEEEGDDDGSVDDDNDDEECAEGGLHTDHGLEPAAEYE